MAHNRSTHQWQIRKPLSSSRYGWRLAGARTCDCSETTPAVCPTRARGAQLNLASPRAPLTSSACELSLSRLTWLAAKWQCLPALKSRPPRGEQRQSSATGLKWCAVAAALQALSAQFKTQMKSSRTLHRPYEIAMICQAIPQRTPCNPRANSAAPSRSTCPQTKLPGSTSKRPAPSFRDLATFAS